MKLTTTYEIRRLFSKVQNTKSFFVYALVQVQ